MNDGLKLHGYMFPQKNYLIISTNINFVNKGAVVVHDRHNRKINELR